MTERADKINPPPRGPQTGLEDLEKKAFYLETLLDTSRELADLVQPRQILDRFLLMVMGALGILQGVGAVINTETGHGLVTGRGIPDPALNEISDDIPRISKKYFPERGTSSGSAPRVKVITGDAITGQGLCSAHMQVLILSDLLPGRFSCLLALGERITGEPLGEQDKNVLLNLANILANSLSHAICFMDIQQMNADLLKKNAELEATIEEFGQTRQNLERRFFHIESLLDLNAELRSLINEDELLRLFLLASMGPIGIEKGFVLVYDREDRIAKTAYRGIENGKALHSQVCEMLLYSAFDKTEPKSLANMSFGRFNAPGIFKEAGIDLEPECGFFFVIDLACMGIAAFGPPVSGQSLSSNEMSLMAGQMSGFMAYLEKARAFSMIKKLNEDLTNRNEQLTHTVQELTRAMNRISALEKARAHFKLVVQKKAERAAKASWLDCALILFFAAAIGLLFNFAPQGISIIPESVKSDLPSTSAAQVRKLVDEGATIIVDARPKELYDRKHIRGAINVPLPLFDNLYTVKLGRLDPKRPIIVYGRTISRLYDVELANRLKKHDHEDVRVLPGGIRAWEAEGGQVE